MIGISRNTNFKPEIRPTHRSHVGVRSKFLKIAYGDKTAKNAARLAEHLYSYLVHLASSEARPERFLKLARRRILHVHYFCCKVAHVTNKYNIDDFLKKALVTYVMLELNVLRKADCSQSKEQSEEYRKELTERVLRLLWTIYSKYYFYLTHRMDRTGVWEMIWRFLRKELPSNVPGFFNVIFDDIKKLLPPEPQHPELPYFTEKCYKSKRIDNSADPLYTECRSQGIKIDLSNGQDGTEKGDSEHEDDEPKRRHSRLEIYRNTSDDIIDLTADDVPTVLTGDVPTVPTGDSVISHEPVANNEVSQYGNVLNQARSLLSAVSQLTGRKGVTIRLIGDRVEIDTTQPGSPLEPNHSLRCIDWQRDYEEPAEAQLSLPSNSASNCDNEPPSDKLQLIFRTEDQQPSCKSNYLESSIKTSTQIMSKVCLDPKQKFIRASSEDITQAQKNMSQIQQSDIGKKPVIHSGTPFNECSSGLFENPKITEDRSDSTIAQPPKVVPSLLQSTIDENSATRSLLTVDSLSCKDTLQITEKLENSTPNISDKSQFGDKDNAQITNSREQKSPDAVPSLPQSAVDANSPLSLHFSTPNTVDKCPVNEVTSNDRFGDGDNVQITTSKEHISEVVPCLPSGSSNNDDVSCEDYIKNKYAVNEDQSEMIPSLPESTVNANSATQSSCVDLSSKNPLQLTDNLTNSTLTRLQFYDEDKSQITASKEQQPSEVAPSSPQSRIDVNSATHQPLSLLTPNTIHKSQVIDPTNYLQFRDHDNSQIAASKDQSSEVVSSLAQSTVDANPAIQSSLSHGNNVSYETNTTPVDKAPSNDQCCDNSQITTSKEQPLKVVPSLTESSLGFSDSDDDLTCKDTFQVPGKLANSTPNIENKNKFGDDYNSQIIASKDEQRSDVAASLSQSSGDANSATQLALSCKADDTLQKIEKLVNSTANITGKFAVNDQTSNNQVDECGNSQITTSKEQPSEEVSSLPNSTVDANSATQLSLLLGSSDDVSDENTLQITGQLVNSPLNTTEKTSINDPDIAEAHNLQTSSSKEQHSGVLPLEPQRQSSLSLGTSDSDKHIYSYISSETLQIISSLEEILDKGETSGSQSLEVTSSKDSSSVPEIVNESKESLQEQLQNFAVKEITNVSCENNSKITKNVTSHTSLIKQSFQKVSEECEDNSQICVEDTNLSSNVLLQPSQQSAAEKPDETTNVCIKSSPDCADITNALPSISLNRSSQDAYNEQTCNVLLCEGDSGKDSHLTEEPENATIGNASIEKSCTVQECPVEQEASVEQPTSNEYSELGHPISDNLSHENNDIQHFEQESIVEGTYPIPTTEDISITTSVVNNGSIDVEEQSNKLDEKSQTIEGQRSSQALLKAEIYNFTDELEQAEQSEITANFATLNQGEEMLATTQPNEIATDIAKEKTIAILSDVVITPSGSKVSITDPLKKTKKGKRRFKWCSVNVNIPEQSTREIKLDKLSCEDDDSTKCDNQTSAENSLKPGVEKPIGDRIANRDNLSKTTSKESSLDCSVEKLFSELSAEDLSAPSNSAVEAKAEDEIAYQDHTAISAENFNTPLTDGAADRQVRDKLSHHDNFEIGARDSDSPSNISKSSLQTYLSDFAVEISAEDLKVPPRKSSQCEDNLQKSKDRADEKKIVQLSGEDKLQITTGTPVDKAPSNDQCCDNSQITTSKEQPLKVIPSLTESSLGLSDSDDDLTCKDTFQVPGKLANSTPNIENKNKFGDDYNSQIIASKDEQRSDVAASLSQSSGDANSATQLALSCKADDTLQKIEKLVNSTANITGKFAVNDQTSNNQVDECGNLQITTSKGQPSEEESSLPKSTVDANSATQSSLLLGSSDDVSDENTLQITGQLVNSPLNTTEKTSINDTDSAEAHNLQDEDEIAYQDRTAISAENFNTPLSDGAADRQVGDKLSHHDNFEIGARDSDSPSNISKLSLQTYLSDFAVEISAEDLKVPPRKSSQCEDNLQKSKDRADEKKIVQLSGEDKLQITTGMTKAAPNLSKQSQQEPVNIPEQSTREIKLNKLSCEDDVSTKCDNQTCAENSPKPGVEKPIGDTTANRDNISKATSKESSLDCSVEKLFSELSVEDLSAPSNSAIEAKAEGEIPYQDHTSISAENFNAPLSDDAADQQVGDKLSHHDNFEIGGRDSDSPSNISKSSLQKYLSDFAVEISAEDLKVPPRKSSQYEDNLQKSKDRADEKKIVQLSGEDKLQITTEITKAAPNLSKQSHQGPNKELPCEDDLQIIDREVKEIFDNPCESKSQKTPTATKASRRKLKKYSKSLKIGNKYIDEDNSHVTAETSQCAVEEPTLNKLSSEGNSHIKMENVSTNSSKPSSQEHVMKEATYTTPNKETTYSITKILQKSSPDCTAKEIPAEVKNATTPNQSFGEEIEKSISDQDKAQITTDVTKASPHKLKQSSRRSSLRPVKKRAGNTLSSEDIVQITAAVTKASPSISYSAKKQTIYKRRPSDSVNLSKNIPYQSTEECIGNEHDGSNSPNINITSPGEYNCEDNSNLTVVTSKLEQNENKLYCEDDSQLMPVITTLPTNISVSQKNVDSDSLITANSSITISNEQTIACEGSPEEVKNLALNISTQRSPVYSQGKEVCSYENSEIVISRKNIAMKENIPQIIEDVPDLSLAVLDDTLKDQSDCADNSQISEEIANLFLENQSLHLPLAPQEFPCEDNLQIGAEIILTAHDSYLTEEPEVASIEMPCTVQECPVEQEASVEQLTSNEYSELGDNLSHENNDIQHFEQERIVEGTYPIPTTEDVSIINNNESIDVEEQSNKVDEKIQTIGQRSSQALLKAEICNFTDELEQAEQNELTSNFATLNQDEEILAATQGNEIATNIAKEKAITVLSEVIITPSCSKVSITDPLKKTTEGKRRFKWCSVNAEDKSSINNSGESYLNEDPLLIPMDAAQSHSPEEQAVEPVSLPSTIGCLNEDNFRNMKNDEMVVYVEGYPSYTQKQLTTILKDTTREHGNPKEDYIDKVRSSSDKASDDVLNLRSTSSQLHNNCYVRVSNVFAEPQNMVLNMSNNNAGLLDSQPCPKNKLMELADIALGQGGSETTDESEVTRIEDAVPKSPSKKSKSVFSSTPNQYKTKAELKFLGDPSDDDEKPLADRLLKKDTTSETSKPYSNKKTQPSTPMSGSPNKRGSKSTANKKEKSPGRKPRVKPEGSKQQRISKDTKGKKFNNSNTTYTSKLRPRSQTISEKEKVNEEIVTAATPKPRSRKASTNSKESGTKTPKTLKQSLEDVPLIDSEFTNTKEGNKVPKAVKQSVDKCVKAIVKTPSNNASESTINKENNKTPKTVKEVITPTTIISEGSPTKLAFATVPPKKRFLEFLEKKTDPHLVLTTKRLEERQKEKETFTEEKIEISQSSENKMLNKESAIRTDPLPDDLPLSQLKSVLPDDLERDGTIMLSENETKNISNLASDIIDASFGSESCVSDDKEISIPTRLVKTNEFPIDGLKIITKESDEKLCGLSSESTAAQIIPEKEHDVSVYTSETSVSVYSTKSSVAVCCSETSVSISSSEASTLIYPSSVSASSMEASVLAYSYEAGQNSKSEDASACLVKENVELISSNKAPVNEDKIKPETKDKIASCENENRDFLLGKIDSECLVREPPLTDNNKSGQQEINSKCVEIVPKEQDLLISGIESNRDALVSENNTHLLVSNETNISKSNIFIESPTSITEAAQASDSDGDLIIDESVDKIAEESDNQLTSKTNEDSGSEIEMKQNYSSRRKNKRTFEGDVHPANKKPDYKERKCSFKKSTPDGNRGIKRAGSETKKSEQFSNKKLKKDKEPKETPRENITSEQHSSSGLGEDVKKSKKEEILSSKQNKELNNAKIVKIPESSSVNANKPVEDENHRSKNVELKNRKQKDSNDKTKRDFSDKNKKSNDEFRRNEKSGGKHKSEKMNEQNKTKLQNTADNKAKEKDENSGGDLRKSKKSKNIPKEKPKKVDDQNKSKLQSTESKDKTKESRRGERSSSRQKEKINDDEQRKIGRSSSKHKDDKRSDQNKIKQTKNENIEGNKVHSKNQKGADSRKIDAEKGSSRIRQSSSKTLECNNRREDLDTKNSLDISQTKKDDEAEKLPIKNAKIASIITDLEKRALIKSPRKSVTFEEKYEQKNEAQIITPNQEDCKATLRQKEKINDDEQRKIGRSSSKHKDDKRSYQNKIKQTKNENIESNKVHSKNQKEADSRKIDAEKGSSRIRQSSSKTLECNNRREDLDTKNSLDISQTKKDDEAEKLPIKNAKIASIITDLEKRALIKSPRKSVTFEEKYEQKNEAQVITPNQEDCKATLMETEAPISLNVSDPIKANIEEKELYIYIDTMVDPANKLINKKRKLSEIEETVKEENIEPPNTETLTKQISSPNKRKRRHSSTATKCTKQTHSDSDSLSTFIKEQFQTSESDKDNIYIPIDLEQVENAVPIKPDYLETPPLIFTNNSAASTPSALHYEFSDFAGITETVETTPLENQDIFDLAFDPVATINSSPFQNTEDQYQFNPKYQDNVKDCISIPSTLSQDGAYQSIPVNTSQGLKAFTETFGDHSYADGVEALKTFQNRLPSNTIDTTISQSKDSPISGHSPTVVIESNNVETTLQYTSIADQEFRNSPRETTESPQLNPVYQGNPSNCIAVTSVPSTLCPATPCQVIPMDTMIGGTLESDRVLDFFTPSIGVPDSSSISESLVSGSLLDASNWDNDLFNYTDGMEGVDVGKNDYTDGMEGVDVGKNDYTDGMVGVDVGKNDYTDGMEGVDVGKNDYTDGMVGVDASNADHALRPSCGPVVPDFYLLAEPNVTMGVSDIEPPVERKKEEIVTPVKKVEEPEKELNFTKRNSRKKKVEPPPRKKGFQQALSSSRAKSGMIPNPGQLSPKDDIKKIPRVRRSTNYTSVESKGTARSHAIKLDSSAKEDSSGNSSTHAEKPRLESRQATKAFEQAVRETKSEAKPELDAFDKLKLEPTNPSFKFKNVGIKKHKDVKKPPREPTPPRKTTQKVQFPDDKNEGPYDWIQKITTKLKKDGKIESIYLAAPSYRT